MPVRTEECPRHDPTKASDTDALQVAVLINTGLQAGASPCDIKAV